MNYLQQLKAFRIRQRLSQLPASAVALWYALAGIANETGMDQGLTLALSTLACEAGLSQDGVKRARNTLKQAGFIQWISRGANRAACYALVDIAVQYAPQSAPQAAPQGAQQAAPVYPTTQSIQHITAPPGPPGGRRPPLDEAGFAAFWAAYPKQVDQPSARRAYAQLSPDQALQSTMLQALSAQCASAAWQREEGRYIPAPARWLAHARWQDKLPPPSAAGAERSQPGSLAPAQGGSAKRVPEQAYHQRTYDPLYCDGPTQKELEAAMAIPND